MNGRLVLGLGGTVDYEISWDSRVIEGLVIEYGITAAELSRSIPIVNERDLVVVLLTFVRDGVGGERFVASSDIVESFAARFEKRITLGGTCVRAAMAMRVLGVTSTLHLVSIDDHVRRMLPDGCAWICSADRDTTDPHLIVQFREDERVRSGDIDLLAPTSNRVIFTNDPPNRELVLSEELGTVLGDAELFMISGFNVIQDRDVLDQRLRDIRRHLERLPAGAIVFYEDSGFHIPALTGPVRDALLDQVDVYSLNEDEMQAYLGRAVDLLDPVDLARALGDLHALIPAATLVVHTRHWALALGDGASSYASALQGGITMASTRYSYGDGFTAADYREVGALPPSERGAELSAALEARVGSIVRCVPAFVLTVEHPTTIGLGDTFVGGFVAALALSRSGTPVGPRAGR